MKKNAEAGSPGVVKDRTPKLRTHMGRLSHVCGSGLGPRLSPERRALCALPAADGLFSRRSYAPAVFGFNSNASAPLPS